MASLEVEIFACERYRPLLGWSVDYLLPTDRHPYRARGCKKTWPTLAEAEAALLAPGWSWEEVRNENDQAVAWEVDPRGQQTDSEGWSYGTNFSATYEGVAKGGVNKFVRWRRLVRSQNFSGGAEALVAGRGNEPAPVCPNVDLEAADRFGRILLEAISISSLHAEWNEPALVQLKSKLLDRILKKDASDKRETFEAMVSSFVNSHKALATRMSEAFKAADADDPVLTARTAEVEARFPAVEREAYAVLAIRRFRPDFACPAIDEAHDCDLRPVLCPHAGCKERCSSKALPAHDQVCPRKLMPCERCREQVPRGELQVHAAAACPHREASCTFSALGCQVPLSHKDIEKHLEDCTQAHLMLVMRGMLQQQDLIRNLTARVGEAEAKNTQLVGALEAERKSQTGIAAQLAALDAKITALDKKTAQDLKKASDGAAEEARKRAEAASQEAKKKVDAAAQAQKAEMDGLRAELDKLRGEVAGLQRAAAAG